MIVIPCLSEDDDDEDDDDGGLIMDYFEHYWPLKISAVLERDMHQP